MISECCLYSGAPGRYQGGFFYPAGDDGNLDMVGEGPGKGFNINVPWPGAGFGDADYLAAWDYVLLPVAKEYAPELIIISAGFDAGESMPDGRETTVKGITLNHCIILMKKAFHLFILMANLKRSHHVSPLCSDG